MLSLIYLGFVGNIITILIFTTTKAKEDDMYDQHALNIAM